LPTATFHNLDDEKKQRIIDASFKEFAKMPYDLVKLSAIIKNSRIPRGSFYQYFKDKKDLYVYLFDLISIKKLEYMGDILPNPEKTPFLELFRILYQRGLEFAIENPIYYKAFKYLFDTRGLIYNELVGDGLEVAKEFYISYVETDKKLGRIRHDIDSALLADLFISATTNIAFDELSKNDKIDKVKMLQRIDSLIQILKKGIE
jgi:AcrR family transcriptional regulator